ncbi:winged helix-turn-helix domain-containing protein [Algibacter sp. PT7-4]|uniref:winged helix-turn-helix domain-containing protein n=1 Tax=Algibacter ulvanivorans TaxID=3400999 RepID=UPI003AAC79EF
MLKLITAVFFLFVIVGNAQEKINDKHIEVALRMIGHRILLNSADSTSRVLPLKKEKNQYKIQFESKLVFNPDSLVSIVKNVVDEAKIASNYIVEVEECGTANVVYSFEMDIFKKLDIIPCQGRVLPKSCYSILFTIIDAKANQNNALFSKTNAIYYIVIAILLIMLLWTFFKKRMAIKGNNANLIPLGNYVFDKKNTELIINHKKIELTSKEADLLLLLYNAANTTVERDVILSMVWGDEGDYIGRTVDVFISKLRKKLELDSQLKIVNVRGVGYKLVTN